MNLHELIDEDFEQPEIAVLNYLEPSSECCATMDKLQFWALIERVAMAKKENIAIEYKESLESIK